MAKTYIFLRPLLILLVMAVLVSAPAVSQVKVKFRMNSATCLDTLRSKHAVKLMGESRKTTTPAMSWTVSSGISMTNLGGDYWETTVTMLPGDTVRFKFWTGFDGAAGTFHWTGWEGPLESGMSGDNRALIVGTRDTTLPLQYFNGWETKLAQYGTPFTSKKDTIAVYFRINMGGASFNPATQIVDVRGGAPIGTDNPWIALVVLSREANSVNAGSFWSGVAYVPKSMVTPGTTRQSFKFVIQPGTWENVSDRSFTFSGTNDTTVAWYYFNDRAPSGPKVTAAVLFRLKLDALEKAKMFNRALGDKIGLTGAKGWPGNPVVFDADTAILKMTYNATLQEWQLRETFSLFPNDIFSYKYYIAWDTTRIDSTHKNFIRGLQLSNGWEEPGSTGGADRRYTFTNATQQTAAGDFGAAQQYFNSLHWKGVITNPIQVTFRINMAPATVVATNPLSALFRPGIDTVYVQFDGSLVSVTQGKTMWGTDNRLRLTDPDGDGIYTGTYSLKAPTFNQFCYRIVYTSASGEVWNGTGSAILGRRYYQYVFPTRVLADSAVWSNTYSLALMPWKSSDLTVEIPPNLDVVSGIENESGNLPDSYQLHQNYPNPFNPSTVVTYSVPERTNVRIDVYNMLGQRVAMLFDQEQAPGTHSVVWNGQNDGGFNVSSGIYLLKMRAGSFSQVKKMVLAR